MTYKKIAKLAGYHNELRERLQRAKKKSNYDRLHDRKLLDY